MIEEKSMRWELAGEMEGFVENLPAATVGTTRLKKLDSVA
jgi:hypothetical protein